MHEAPFTVLVVDDDTSVRHLILQVLERNGFAPMEAASGAPGLELFQANRDRIDLVILDMVMPGMSGLDVGAELDRQKPGVKILYISAHGASIAMESLQKQSAERVLLKPFTEQSLVERLAHLLGSADAPSESSGCQSGN